MSARILIIDDDQTIIDSCLRILSRQDCQVQGVRDGFEALRWIAEHPCAIVLLDVVMPKIDGLDILRRIKEGHPDTAVIMLTDFAGIKTAVRAMKCGAFDYLPKPIDPDELKLAIQHALERRQLLRENLDLKIEVAELTGTFNTMTAALRESQAKLRESAHALERKVEQRTAELRLVQAEAVRGEKLASVGLLASGVAHELNNPLTGVLAFSHLLRQNMPEGSQEAEDMDVVIRETKRCASIIRRLLDFARDRPPEKKFADLNQIVEETECIVERPAHLHDIAISMDLDRDLPPVWVDPDQIKQVVMNLLANAQHAIDGKGRIVIRTRRLPQSDPGEVPMMEFSITDTGSGIPDDNLKRIFDPFFTTKSGKGTGLGLSVSHGIVEAHGGAITVESEPGHGSSFRVMLPLIQPSKPMRTESVGAVH